MTDHPSTREAPNCKRCNDTGIAPSTTAYATCECQLQRFKPISGATIVAMQDAARVLGGDPGSLHIIGVRESDVPAPLPAPEAT